MVGHGPLPSRKLSEKESGIPNGEIQPNRIKYNQIKHKHVLHCDIWIPAEMIKAIYGFVTERQQALTFVGILSGYDVEKSAPLGNSGQVHI